MKLRYFFLMMISLLISSALMASGSEDFNFDNQSLEREFSALSALEALVVSNNYPDIAEMEENSMLAPDFLSNNQPFHDQGEDPLGIPGFWWGCVLGPVGIIAAYILSDNNKEQARMALNGCIVATAVEVAVILVWYVVILSWTWNYSI